MKIIMIANGMEIGGAETHVLELSTTLSHKGHCITVASPYGRYTKELQNRGISVAPIHTYDGSALSLVKQLRDIFKLCRKTHPDVLHAHTRPGALISVITGRALSIPVVTTAHLPFEKKKLNEKFTCWGDHVLAVSEDIKKHLIQHYSIPKKDVTIIRNGIDTERFSPTGNLNQKVVHISRLDRDRSKTAELLISIAPKLAKTTPCEGIVIVGDGECFKSIKQKQKQANKKIGKEFVRLIGAKTDIEKELKDRPIFVGVSRAALEAMACECAIILCGNEGYVGSLNNKNAKKALKKNFCCRNREIANEDKLLYDLKILLQKTNQERLMTGCSMREIVLHSFQSEKMAEISEEAYKTAIRKKNPGIMLCGYYGYGNIGDESVLPLIIQKCSRFIERITVMSRHPQSDQKRYGVKCINRYSIVDFFRFFRRGDILIFGGGNLFQNETSQRSLLYYLLIAAFAKMKNGKLAIVRCGIGKLHGSHSKKMMNVFLKNCNYITCRTPNDLLESKYRGGLQKAKFSADSCLFLNTFKKEKRPPFSVATPYCVVVCKRTTKKRIIQKAKAINTFCNTHNLTPVFLLFDEKEDAKSTKIASTQIKKSKLISTSKQNEIKKIIEGSQVVLTDRLHAAYFALVLNRPFYFLEKTEKNIRHIQYIKRCFEKANASSSLLLNSINHTQPIPSPLTNGDHARVLTTMIKGNKGI